MVQQLRYLYAMSRLAWDGQYTNSKASVTLSGPYLRLWSFRSYEGGFDILILRFLFQAHLSCVGGNTPSLPSRTSRDGQYFTSCQCLCAALGGRKNLPDRNTKILRNTSSPQI